MRIRRKLRHVWAVPALLTAALAVACADAAPPEPIPTATDAPTVETPEPTPTTAPDSADLPLPISALDAPGQVAAIGADGNLYVLQRGQPPRALTDDASPELEYEHLTWSPEGWLAYVRNTARVGTASVTDVLAVPPGAESPRAVLEESPAPFIYGYWSPTACDDGPACARFAYLLNEDNAVTLHLAELDESASTARDEILGRDTSFYYSWAPSGDQMLWYRGERQIAVYRLNGGDAAAPLPDRAGLFLSPVWSPVGDALLFARADGEASRVTIADGEDRVDLGLPVEGYVHFAWSPDGEHVAYSGGGDPLQPVTVIQADGSGGRTFANITEVVAFFWSPDSTKLAVVSLEPRQEPLREASRPAGLARPAVDHLDPANYAFAWHVIDMGTGETTFFTQFFPTPEQWFMLRFFDQYAQSHRIWSPDSRFIVYADQQPDGGRAAVRLLDTTRADLRPQMLLPGTSAVFSFAAP